MFVIIIIIIIIAVHDNDQRANSDVYYSPLVRVWVQIVVEGVVGSGVQGDLAIDDLTISNGSCPHAGQSVC